MNNHATLSQAFDEYANYEITDEDLAIKIEENHSPFFHPFQLHHYITRVVVYTVYLLL